MTTGRRAWASRVRPGPVSLAVAVAAWTATTAPAHAAGAFSSVGASSAGDLTGNLPLGAYLLIPLALVLAFVTAVVLGPRGDPGASVRRSGGVSRALRRAEPTDDPSS